MKRPLENAAPKEKNSRRPAARVPQPSPLGDVTFVEGAHPRARSLYPDPKAAAGGESALKTAATFLKRHDVTEESLAARIHTIANDHWFERRWNERIPRNELGLHFKPILKSAVNLLSTLRLAPDVVQRLSFERGRAWTGKPGVPGIIANLESLVTACEEVTPPGRRGAPSKSYIYSTVWAVIDLYAEVTGDSSLGNRALESGKSGAEFDSASAQFASLLVRAIDPDISLKSIRTAIKQRRPIVSSARGE